MLLLLGWGGEIVFFLCMCSRKCICFVISIDIVFVAVMLKYQNLQFMVILLAVVDLVRTPPRVLIVGVPATSGRRW